MSKFEGFNNVFEKQVLDVVSNIPVEYNPKGWENLSKQLDAELPLNETKISASLKLWLISMGVSTILVILLLTNYSGRATNSITEKKDVKSGAGAKLHLEPTTSNQEKRVFPKAWNLEDELTKPKKNTHDSIMNDFSVVGWPNQLMKIALDKEKDEVLLIHKDSTELRFQPKQEEKDTVFIFW